MGDKQALAVALVFRGQAGGLVAEHQSVPSRLGDVFRGQHLSPVQHKGENLPPRPVPGQIGGKVWEFLRLHLKGGAHGGPAGFGVPPVRAPANEGQIFHPKAQKRALNGAQIPHVSGLDQGRVRGMRVQLAGVFLKHARRVADFLLADAFQGFCRALAGHAQLGAKGMELLLVVKIRPEIDSQGLFWAAAQQLKGGEGTKSIGMGKILFILFG